MRKNTIFFDKNVKNGEIASLKWRYQIGFLRKKPLFCNLQFTLVAQWNQLNSEKKVKFFSFWPFFTYFYWIFHYFLSICDLCVLPERGGQKKRKYWTFYWKNRVKKAFLLQFLCFFSDFFRKFVNLFNFRIYTGCLMKSIGKRKKHVFFSNF